MASKKLAREAKKRTQEAISGGSVAQPPHRGGQGRAEAPQDTENGGAPQVNNMNAQMAQLLATLNQNPAVAAALATAGTQNHPALGPFAIGCITDNRQSHSAAWMCLTNTPRDAEPILDFYVILQFRSRLISLFL